MKGKRIRVEVLNGLCNVLQTLKDCNVSDYFTMRRRYIFSREEYENLKNNNEIKNSWYTIGPSYTDGETFMAHLSMMKNLSTNISRDICLRQKEKYTMEGI